MTERVQRVAQGQQPFTDPLPTVGIEPVTSDLLSNQVQVLYFTIIFEMLVPDKICCIDID